MLSLIDMAILKCYFIKIRILTSLKVYHFAITTQNLEKFT